MPRTDIGGSATKRITDRAVRFIERNLDRPFFLYVPHIMPHVPIHVSAAFKDTSILQQYTFLPPVKEISEKAINLSNFRTLFTDKETVQGPVNFWRYVGNSIFLASVLAHVHAQGRACR